MSIIDKPSDYFETKLYTGTQQARNITGLDFAPNWVWIKKRTGASGTSNHYLFDSVRGASKTLFSNATNAEDTNTNSLTAFNSDGFSLGNDTDVNVNNGTFVSWNWKAGASFTNDASGTGIGSIDSAGSFNNDSGFSIVSYTGTGSNGTIKHGLNTAPKVVILKSRSDAQNWMVGMNINSSINFTDALALNQNYALEDYAGYWNDTAPTSSVVSLGSHNNTNGSSKTYIAYCFAEKKGYSKFGSYVGNGNANGTFTYLGFKPAWVMTKISSATGQWGIADIKRGVAPSGKFLFADSNAATNNAPNNFDFLSNGFKPRADYAAMNTSGATYIYMAFAENPFTTSTGVPATAR